MKNFIPLKYYFIILIFYFRCNKQSQPLKYDESIVKEPVDGYTRDMHIHGDTLFAVSESDGLLLYKINENENIDRIILDSLWSDSTYFQDHNENMDLSGVLFSDKNSIVFILDKYYSTYFLDISDTIDVNNIELLINKLDSEHHSKFTLNYDLPVPEVFILVRHRSDYSKTDVSEIYMAYWGDFGLESFGIIDSLNYDATDIFYFDNKLFVSNTNAEEYEINCYDRKNINEPFVFQFTIQTYLEPISLYVENGYLFVGFNHHGGVKIYTIDNLGSADEIEWLAQGFSIREIDWDYNGGLLLLSCGYQGVVIFELGQNLNRGSSWILGSSYSYAARNYKHTKFDSNHILVSTRNGIEIFKLKE